MIAVLIPTRSEDLKIAEKVAKLHKTRAGMPCEVFVLEDKEKIGWIAMLNKAVKKIDAKYYVYSCADYFPGRDWLKIAYQTLIKDKLGLVGFNDGKWHGAIATTGLISKEYLFSNYGGDLFFNKYQKHWADTELTLKAKKDGVYGYNPNAVLVEVDFEKDNIVSDKRMMEDEKLFDERGYEL